MCEYSWFQKHTLFYSLSFTVGNSVLCTLLAVSPASAPLPSFQQPFISIWGSVVKGGWFHAQLHILSLLCSKASSWSLSYTEWNSSFQWAVRPNTIWSYAALTLSPIAFPVSHSAPLNWWPPCCFSSMPSRLPSLPFSRSFRSGVPNPQGHWPV